MNYEIKGGAFPLVICMLDKGETMKSEGGSMAFMSSAIKMETSTGGGIVKAFDRTLTGESIFLNFFKAEEDNQAIGFACKVPGKIIPMKLDGSKKIIAQKASYLASEKSVEVKSSFSGAGNLTGEGLILQKLSGRGIVFLEFHGGVIEYYLEEGEKLIMNPKYFAAMDETVDFDIKVGENFKNVITGGQGLFLGTLTGPGNVWIETMP